MSLLSVERVSRRFGPERAVAEVDLTVEPGEIHALVGLNGAGKTTLMRLALGMVRPDSGRVRITVPGTGGVPTDVACAPTSTWAHVGHLIETPFAYAELTAAETILAAARLRGLEPAEARDAAHAVLSELALDHWAGRRARTLSLGNRQRLGLACALVHRPSLLVLDEPSNALDPAGVVRVRQRLVSATRAGAGALVSSHHLDEMARMADRITVLNRGRVIGTLPPGGTDLERQFFELVLADDQDVVAVP